MQQGTGSLAAATHRMQRQTYPSPVVWNGHSRKSLTVLAQHLRFTGHRADRPGIVGPGGGGGKVDGRPVVPEYSRRLLREFLGKDQLAVVVRRGQADKGSFLLVSLEIYPLDSPRAPIVGDGPDFG